MSPFGYCGAQASSGDADGAREGSLCGSAPLRAGSKLITAVSALRRLHGFAKYQEGCGGNRSFSASRLVPGPQVGWGVSCL